MIKIIARLSFILMISLMLILINAGISTSIPGGFSECCGANYYCKGDKNYYCCDGDAHLCLDEDLTDGVCGFDGIGAESVQEGDSCGGGDSGVCSCISGDYECTGPVGDKHCCPAGEEWDGDACVPACSVQEGTCSQTSDCCPDLYCDTSPGMCCPQGSEWVAGEGCVGGNPCYSGFDQSGYCLYQAPDAPSPESNWWDANKCIATRACCYEGSGLYGYEPGDEFYYWHETDNIVVY